MIDSPIEITVSIFRWETRAPILGRALLVLMLVGVSVSCKALQAQKQNKPAAMTEQERPLADSHSFMELFTKLEDQWTQAIQKRDRSGLEALLAPEFIVSNAEDPEHSVVRDAWMSDALSGPEIESFSHNGMAIRAFMGVAIVSFTQIEQQKVNGKVRTVRSFVVDVWEVNHQHWLVAERYFFPVGSR